MAATKSWRPPNPKRKDYIPERQFSFESAPPPIPSTSIKETLTTEVLVVGAGVSGVCAALAAAEKSARVILIEKTNSYQGFGGDNSFIGSRLQKQLGIEIDPNEVVLNLQRFAGNRPDQRLVRHWAEHGAETMDWIMDMTDAAGMKVAITQYPPPAPIDNSKEYYPHYLSCHHYEKGERELVKCLLDNAIQKGVEVHYQIRAQQLLRKGRGRVTGLVAKNKDGDYIRYKATKAVILCTGEYGNNAEMMAKYCPEFAEMGTILATATGDGHQMAMWIGAMMEPSPHAPMVHSIYGPLGCCAFLQVNQKGERFQNEDVLCEVYVDAVRRQPGNEAWQVFDADFAKALPRMGIGIGKFLQVDEESLTRMKQSSVSADSLEELAAKMEVPADVFSATIKRYNQLARLGKDLDFGKRGDRLTLIKKPPFYAGKGFYWFLCAMGGLMVNTRLQPVDKDFNAIPGLYLGGNIIGNRFGVRYPSMLPGLSNGMALHYGRVAGMNAVTLEK